MYTLFIDTHFNKIVLALYKNSSVFDILEIESKSHSVIIMPSLEKLLKSNNLLPKDINEIIVCNGPGSFTGVRLGVTIAKVYAYSLNIKIKSITSLECIAISSKKEKVLSCLDDNNGIYYGLFSERKLINDYNYVTKKDFDKYVIQNDLKDIIVFNDKYDYNKIYDYMKNKKYENVHDVNPIYVKKIGVGND